MINTLIEIVFYGVLGIAVLVTCLIAFYYAFRAIFIVPWLLALVWFLFFMGLPIYWAVTYERYLWLASAALSWPAAFLPWRLSAYIEEKYPEFSKAWSDMMP